MRTHSLSKRLSLIAMLALLGSGCGRGNLPELGSVSGRITLDGKPVEGVHIEFIPLIEGRPSAAASDSSGHYVLSYKGSVKGARVGEHKVIMTTLQEKMTFVESTDDEEPTDGGSEDSEIEITTSGRAEEIPAKYFKSPLRVTVEQGSNTVNLTLDSEQ